MNRCFGTWVLCAAMAAAVSAQTPKYGVTVTAEKGVDFSRFKTYKWSKGQPSAIKAIDAAIVAAVDRELGALGLTGTTSAPGDVTVTYYSLSRTDVNLKAKRDATGKYPEYSVGTLVVTMVEPGSQRRVLRLRTDTPIDTKPAELEADINRAVAEMFAKYPTRRSE